jgi:PKD repeat protein
MQIDLGWGLEMDYPEVFLDGQTRMEVNDQGPALPPGYTPGSPLQYYHLSTTAGYTGPIKVCITYDETAYAGQENLLHLLGNSNGLWQDLTISLDTTTNEICGKADQLGDFAVAIGPSAWLPPPPLSVAASAAPTLGPPPLTVSFSSSVTGGVSPFTYLWQFSDGSTSSLPDPSHTFGAFGDYSITLIVTDFLGDQVLDTLSITVAVERETPPGSYVRLDLGHGVVLIFPEVFQAGRTRLMEDGQGPALPPGYTPGSPLQYYHLSTTAGYDGEILVCITYDETLYAGEERRLHLLHLQELGDWEDITVMLGTDQNEICGLTPTLSDFAIAKGAEWPAYEPPPPAPKPAAAEENNSGSCGSIPNTAGGPLGAPLALIAGLFLSLRLRKGHRRGQIVRACCSKASSERKA